MASLLFHASKIIAVPSVNPIPNPQKPGGTGNCTGFNVSFMVGTPAVAIPKDFDCDIYKNGILVASSMFTEVAGQNSHAGSASFDFNDTDDLSVRLTWNPLPGTLVSVDWSTINITLDLIYQTVDTVISDCPTTGSCGAAFTKDQLLDLWKSTVDPSFSQQMLLLGEGEGSLEHVTQAFEQLAKVSCAVDRTTQAMFTLPWSGQTGSPGEGAQQACTRLTLTRKGFINFPIILSETVYAEEIKNDAGETGPVEVHTGRHYRIKDPVVFNCSELEPITTYAEAAKVGYGYNYPLPNDINRLVQIGSNFSNVNAQIVNESNSWVLKSDNEPDVIIPQHVGQYIQIGTGPNGGQIYRIRGYLPPQPEATPPTGGTAVLDVLVVFECLALGAFVPGELVIQNTTGAQGILYKVSNLDSGFQRVVISVRYGTFQTGASPAFDIIGQQSLSVIDVDTTFPGISKIIDQTPTPDLSVSWNILDWVKDIGITVFNPESPSGGRLAYLDEQGSEKNLPRSPGESDDSYRERISKLADVVSPNALRRVANRILAPFGFAGCLREIGQLLYQGFYYDAPFAYDLDCCVVEGILGSGSFTEGEPVLVNVTPDLLPLGTAGVANGYYAGNSGLNYYFSRKGINSWDGVTNLYVIGLQSGAILQVTSIVLKRIRPQDRFKTYMSYEEFRAFFMMGVPPLDLGEFGLFYDDYYYAAYDASPFLVYYDGFPTTTAILYKSIYNALYNAKAGGVGFDLYQEGIGCI